MGDLVVIDDGFWVGRSVLVTGVAGLLGSWVATTLARRGARVVGLDVRAQPWPVLGGIETVRRVQGDVCDSTLVTRLLKDYGIDAVIHLAAQAIVGSANQDPTQAFEDNVRGTWTILESCRMNPHVRVVVVASSDKAYGDAGGVPYTEDMPLRARHPYDVSKACADLISQAYAESFELPVAVTRCGNLYGGGDLHWTRIVPETIRSALEGRRPLIRSDGSYVRDYLYVEDAVAGVLAIGQAVGTNDRIRGHAFNLAADERLSVLELVNKILTLMGSDVEPDIRNEAVNEIPAQRTNSEKVRALLGWAPVYSLDEGLILTIDWYRDYLGVGA